jgi:hypothetical protein
VQRRTLLLVVVTVTVVDVACGGSKTPTAPATPPVPACQANNTASVRFGNRAANTTQDVFWDGLRVTTLTPGQDSTPLTAAAGVAHRMEFRITNTNFLACAVTNPIPVQCSTPIYTCAFP